MLMKLPSSVENQGPTLATLVEVGRVLEEARREPPLSLSEIERRMRAKSTRHATLRACVEFLESLALVTTGSEGAQWTYSPSNIRGPVGYRSDLLDPPASLDEMAELAGIDVESIRGIAAATEDAEADEGMWKTVLDLQASEALWRSREAAALELYGKVEAPLTQARRHLAEDVDFDAASDAIDEGILSFDNHPRLLADVGADGEPRFPRYFQTHLRNEMLEVKRALDAEEYDAAIRALDRVESAVEDRRSQEIEALKQAKDVFRRRWHEEREPQGRA